MRRKRTRRGWRKNARRGRHGQRQQQDAQTPSPQRTHQLVRRVRSEPAAGNFELPPDIDGKQRQRYRQQDEEDDSEGAVSNSG